MARIFFNSIIFFILIYSCSCSSLTEESSSSKKISAFKMDTLQSTIEIDTLGFLEDCKLLMNNAYEGALQGNNAGKDSNNYLCFSACYNCSQSYEIIFVLKGGIAKRKAMGYDLLFKEFQKGCDNKFSEFDCFCFVLPMRDPEKQEDIHAMNIDFPVQVKVYKRTSEDQWKFLEKIRVNSFHEYSLLQLKTIYQLK